MLTKENVKLTFIIFQLYSFINFIPFQVNLATYNLREQRSKIKISLWKFNCVIAFIYYVLGCLQLLRSIIARNLMEISNFPIHFSFAMAIILLITCCCSHWFYRNNTATIANELVDIYSNKRTRWSWSFQELLLISVAPSLICINLLLHIFLAISPNRMQLPHTLLAENLQTGWTIFTSVSISCYYSLFCVSSLSVPLFLQLCFFQKLAKLGQISGEWKSVRNLRDVNLKKLRQLQCLMNSFNESQAYVIYGMKTYMISTAIVMVPFAIHSFHIALIPSTISVTIAFYCSISYIIFYNRAASFPTKLDLLKRKLLLRSVNGFMYSDKLLVTMLRSVPMLAIKVGSFHHVERESTPIFLDFVIKQMTGLLITAGSY